MIGNLTWVQLVWPMMAAVSLTLGVIHFGAWFRKGTRWAHLMLTGVGLSAAALGGIELGLMEAATPEQWIAIQRWGHAFVFSTAISLAGFAHFHFSPARRWLLAAVLVTRGAVVALAFALPYGVNYQSVIALRRVVLPGGAPVSTLEGTPSPWTLLALGSWIFLIALVADCAAQAWRRNPPARRTRVASLGAAMVAVLVLPPVLAHLVHTGVIHMPYFITPVFFFVSVVLAIELSLDLAHVNRLADDLSVSRDLLRRTELERELAAAEARSELTHLARIAVLGELGASLAHEINQPLAAILSNAEAAQRYLAREPVDFDELRAILADIVADDRRAGEVIRRLRAMLRKEELPHVDLDLEEVLRGVLQILRSDFINRGVTIETELANRLPTIEGDPIQLQQVLLNLLSNGCDAMAGNPHPRILRVSTRVGDGDGAVELEVADRGTGIPEQDLERIFQPFVTTKEHGTGLGLAVCKRIVTDHGGTIRARNRSDGGAVVSVTLPTARSRARG